jgi:hypothetical protein
MDGVDDREWAVTFLAFNFPPRVGDSPAVMIDRNSAMDFAICLRKVDICPVLPIWSDLLNHPKGGPRITEEFPPLWRKSAPAFRTKSLARLRVVP